MKYVGWSIVFLMLSTQLSIAQNPEEFTNITTFNNLDSFRNPGKNWIIASDAFVDLSKSREIKPIAGEGAVVNIPETTNRTHLFTKEEFGDVEVQLDFMMARNSNSGVYLEGRYEIQLLDSWKRLQASASDVGGIYLRWKKERGIFEGTPPIMNVAKAPGLWQHLLIKFRAPRFNEKGEKIRNARFEQVYLNGVLVQQQSDVTGPTGSSMFQDEKPTGPIVLQGDHGPVAFKNFQYRILPPEKAGLFRPQSYQEQVNPILIKPEGYPYVLRSFMHFGNKKLTYTVSVGSASQIHYSYDLKRGAIFQIWRGDFLDATPMWHERGYEQAPLPLGSVVSLSDAPALAILSTEQTAWPDSVGFNDLQGHGYSLDKQQRTPIFRYRMYEMEIRDSVAARSDREGIARTITVSNAPDNLYCRVAAGSNIENISDNLYAVSGKSYYIQIEKDFKPVIRQVAGGQEIIVRYDPAAPLTYSIIW